MSSRKQVNVRVDLIKATSMTALVWIALAGCSEVTPMKVVVEHSQVYFVVAEGEAVEIAVDAIHLLREDCAQDCVYWERRVKQQDFDLPPVYLLGDRIAYGAPIPLTAETVPPQSLAPGRYLLTASITLRKHNGDLGGGTFGQRFELNQNNGQWTISATD